MSNKDAVGILRGIKDRVSELEESRSSQEGLPNLLRFTTDQSTSGDATDARENDAKASDQSTTGDVTNARENDALNNRYEYALKVDSTRIRTGVEPAGMASDEVTVAVRFEIPTGFASWRDLCEFNWTQSGAFNLNIDKNGFFNWSATDSDGNIKDIARDDYPTLDTRITVVATVDFGSGTGALWADGTKLDSTSGLTLKPLTPSDGRISVDSQDYETILERVEVWNRVLSDSEIQSYFDGHPVWSGKFVWWDLDEGGGTAISDHSRYNNPGTLGTPGTWLEEGGPFRDETQTGDAVTVSTDEAGGWTWDESHYDFDEWA